MGEPNPGPRGLKIRPTENILTEMKQYAERAEAIRDLGSRTSQPLIRERQRLIRNLIEDCQWLQMRDLGLDEPTDYEILL